LEKVIKVINCSN